MQLSKCSVFGNFLLGFHDLWSVYNYYHRIIRDDFLLVSVDIGTYMRLDLLLGSAKGCLGSTCISLCGWKGVILSLSLSLYLSLSRESPGWIA